MYWICDLKFGYKDGGQGLSRASSPKATISEVDKSTDYQKETELSSIPERYKAALGGKCKSGHLTLTAANFLNTPPFFGWPRLLAEKTTISRFPLE